MIIPIYWAYKFLIRRERENVRELFVNFFRRMRPNRFAEDDFEEAMDNNDNRLENSELDKLREGFELTLGEKNKNNEYDSIGEVTCTICLLDYEPGNEILKLPCNHSFHSICVGKWLETNAICPLCKSNVKEYLNTTN